MHSLLDTQLLASAEGRRIAVSASLRRDRQARLGQFLTPSPVAAFLASLFEVPAGDAARPARLLDPGAGVGSLSAAFADRWIRHTDRGLDITAVELDPGLHPPLAATLAACERQQQVSSTLVAEDFLEWAAEAMPFGFAAESDSFDFVVMNPPYGKVRSTSRERRIVERFGVEISNIYAAFLVLAVRLLRNGGQMVAITPRSFANGPYFRSFRKDFLAHMAFRRIHVYETRDTAFADDEVLQENVIFHAVKSAARSRVQITSSWAAGDSACTSRDVDHSEVVRVDDREAFIHLPTDALATEIATRMKRLPARLEDTGLSVSTGRVVDFRARRHLRADPAPGTAALVYPSHFHKGGVRWPIRGGRKCNAIAIGSETASLLVPNGVYVLVKRFTSKEERRRVVAVVCDPDMVPGDVIGFENHVNVFHDRGQPLDPAIARGLATYLSSALVDLYFRQWSGHTQVNATDLRSLRYPTRAQLATLGSTTRSVDLSNARADRALALHIPELADAEGVGLLMAHDRVNEALDSSDPPSRH